MKNKGYPTIAAHYQCYKQPKAVMQALQSFRSIYPDSTVCMVSNNGMDLSHVAEYFECDYAHSDKAASTISTYCPDEDSFKLYMERLYTTAKKAKEDYVMILSEDVRIFKPLRTLKYDLNGGRGYWKGKLIKGAQALFFGSSSYSTISATSTGR